MSNPWDDAPDLWKSEKHFCQWLRSQSRRIWARHPIKNRYKAAATVDKDKLGGATETEFKLLYPRAKKAVKCEMCQSYFPSSNIEVDHITPAGSFMNVEQWHDWLKRLLVIGFDGIRLLCKPCHLNVTLAEKFNCNLDQVWAYQAVAAFNKMKVAEARKAMVAQGLDFEGLNLKQMKAEYKHHMMEAIKNV